MTSTTTSKPGAAVRSTKVALPSSRMQWILLAMGLAGTAYLLYAPVLLRESFQRTLGGVFMFATLALAWNIIGGFTGYASFGNVVFFGLGGYTVATLMAKAGWTFWPSLIVAGLVGTLFALLIGLPVLRLRGHYFAIATLGVAEGMREVVLNVPSVTGGGAGITIPAVGAEATTSYAGDTGFYYYFFILMFVALAITWGVSKSRFGYSLRAIHQDEDSAAALGINTTRAKVAAFMLSGLLTALAGAIFAFQQVTIYPNRLFSVEITVLIVVMAVIGGTGTIMGPVVGAFTLQFLSEYLRQNYLDLHTLIFGAIVIIAVIFLPQGILQSAGELRSTGRIRFLANIKRNRL